jgi:hypothetical protein
VSRLPEQVAILLAVADGGTDELLGAYVDAEEAHAEAEAYNQRWSITPWEPNWQYVMQVPLTPPH